MFQLEGIKSLTRALILLGTELAVVIVICVLLGFLARLVLGRVGAIPGLGNPTRNALSALGGGSA